MQFAIVSILLYMYNDSPFFELVKIVVLLLKPAGIDYILFDIL